MKYIPSLDGLRAVAILLVIGFHKIGPLSSAIGQFFNGWAGVDIFFVISGYLITSILLKERSQHGQISLTRFYTRRWLRIAPAYYFFLAVAAFIQFSEGNHHFKPFLLAGLYLTNVDLAFGWHLIPMRTGLAHFWSLALEEQFYLTWPLCLKVMRRHAVKFVAGCILLVYIWRLYLVAIETFWLRISGGFDTRIDTLMCGVLLALLLEQDSIRCAAAKHLTTKTMQIASLLLTAIALHILGHPKEGGMQEHLIFWGAKMPLLLVSVTMTICAVILNPNGPVAVLLSRRVLVFTGKLSYSIYLWHILIRDEFARRCGEFVVQNPLPAELVQFLLILGVASISYYVVEKPFLKLKTKFSNAE